MPKAKEEKKIANISENGLGKCTELEEYRIQSRGGKGIKTMQLTEKTGKLIAIKAVTDRDDLMIINKSGLTIRFTVEQLPINGRSTQGVKLINLKGGDAIADVALIKDADRGEEEDMVEEGEASSDEAAAPTEE